MRKAQVWVTKRYSEGIPTLDDFKCIEEDVPPCKDGDIIIEAQVYSVDPYHRYQIRQKPIGSIITGSQIAKVVESKNKDYPVGCLVVGYPGWRSVTRVTKEDLQTEDLIHSYRRAPDFGKNPISLGLGTIGMPGNTAYFGFLEICKPKPGDVVVVNSAAGAVGNVVCQIAKIKGCKVIAFSGSDAKVEWVKSLGVDYSFNYKKVKIYETLKEYAPNGINCFFDNVGGEFTSEVLPNMATYGRISICGCISTYNDESKDIGKVAMTSPYAETTLLHSQLRAEGFLVARWMDRWDEGLQNLKKWVDEGKIKYKETVFKGFENMPKAFISLFEGESIGKVIIQA